jgi:hypothetical protein
VFRGIPRKLCQPPFDFKTVFGRHR